MGALEVLEEEVVVEWVGLEVSEGVEALFSLLLRLGEEKEAHLLGGEGQGLERPFL